MEAAKEVTATTADQANFRQARGALHRQVTAATADSVTTQVRGASSHLWGVYNNSGKIGGRHIVWQELAERPRLIRRCSQEMHNACWPKLK